ncbi:hypothetical protein XMIN_168 [Xanthomonas citri pv. mangiferaeindicae LMG 941]|nr:hypothetical protein XAPC_2177 [Xanthomonas citri pv. punicae str. LMG 859]CCG35217.1 hypothetical protein XMIN_168 [Xanthomonas citri pv. mangiferaeindicae LMG 941]
MRWHRFGKGSTCNTTGPPQPGTPASRRLQRRQRRGRVIAVSIRLRALRRRTQLTVPFVEIS